MEDVDFKGESEEERIFRETLDRIDDIQYSDLPMDWDPNVDLLESFEPNYLEDKTFDINSRIFKRFDVVDLRIINVKKKVIKELTGADVNAKTKGYAKELYDNLTFDEDSKSILSKNVHIFIRDLTNNNLVITNELQEFKRLVGRVIVETDENRKVNEEEAKQIRLSLERTRNKFVVENDLYWDSTADLFANTFDERVIETDPIGFNESTQTQNNELENIQLRREMAGAIKESIDVNGFLERDKNSPDIEDKDSMGFDKIQGLTTDVIEWDKRSKDERRNGRNDNAVLFEQIRDLEIKSANFMEVSYFDTNKPKEDIKNDVTRLNRFKNWIRENFGTVAIFSSLIIAIAGLITGLTIKSRNTICTAAGAAYKGCEFLITLTKVMERILEPALKALSKFLSFIGDLLGWISKNYSRFY